MRAKFLWAAALSVVGGWPRARSERPGQHERVSSSPSCLRPGTSSRPCPRASMAPPAFPTARTPTRPAATRPVRARPWTPSTVTTRSTSAGRLCSLRCLARRRWRRRSTTPRRTGSTSSVASIRTRASSATRPESLSWTATPGAPGRTCRPRGIRWRPATTARTAGSTSSAATARQIPRASRHDVGVQPGHEHVHCARGHPARRRRRRLGGHRRPPLRRRRPRRTPASSI